MKVIFEPSDHTQAYRKYSSINKGELFCTRDSDKAIFAKLNDGLIQIKDINGQMCPFPIVWSCEEVSEASQFGNCLLLAGKVIIEI